ncbi:tyrosinase cofactor, partial [Streptomyces sp. TRM76130]|nr:tyrosinase cofactor [Streptomyces sp. TRM76130]
TAPADLTADAGIWHVTVDGRPLHLLRRADGTWLTMVDHYRSYPTPLQAARAAVDELGPGRHLRETDH